MTEATAPIVNAPLFMPYSQVRHCIRAWDGEEVKLVRDLIKSVHQQTGTPQNPVDWANPEQWIPERLVGEHERLAKKIWSTSNGEVNPRHIYGCYLLINRLKLMSQNGDIFSIDDRAKKFLSEDPHLLDELDKSEGLPKLLSLVSESSPAKRSDLIEDWSTYLQGVSKFSTLKTFKDTLARRLKNLLERGLIERDGIRYSITDLGIKYLSRTALEQTSRADTDPRTNVTIAARRFNIDQMKVLKMRLMELEPYDFEHFVKSLLEAMDYENVEVTKQSGDRGVDVIADFQFGITEIREVVQVKRTETNIGRPVIDQLRGALPYHGAIRGTIITLGGFVRGIDKDAVYQGAAPISLIDGDRLIELAVKHQVGIRSKPIDLYEVDRAFFARSSDNEGVDNLVEAENEEARR